MAKKRESAAAKKPKKASKKKRAKREPLVFEPILGGSDDECRAALAARLAAHIAECEPVAEHAARADEALLALEEKEEAEAARRAELRERGVDEDGWEVVTYKKKAVNAEPKAPSQQRKKRERDAKRAQDADFYRFQIKRQRLAEMRSTLDARRDGRKSRAPQRRGLDKA